MLKRGQPGAVNTSWSLLWIPPAVMHVITGKTTNKSGGIFYASGANTIYDLDTKKHVGPTNWKPIGESNVDPVSYTHLDVYKRQIFKRGKG